MLPYASTVSWIHDSVSLSKFFPQSSLVVFFDFWAFVIFRLFLQFTKGSPLYFPIVFAVFDRGFWLSPRQSRPQNGCHSTIDQGKDDHDKLLPRARLSLLTLCNREQCLIDSTVCQCILRHFPLWLLFWFQLEFHESFNPFFPSFFSLLLCNRSCRIWGRKIPRRSVISKWMSRTFCSGRRF